MNKYLIIVEKTETGYSAFSPDLPGCVATGKNRDEVEQAMRDAIQFHLDGMREDGEIIPVPHSYSTYCEVPA
jgi:predicted RNase H-like HicB family nuclease